MGSQVKRDKHAEQLYVINAIVYGKGSLNTRIDLKDIVDLTSPDIVSKLTAKLDKRYRKKGYSNPQIQDSTLLLRVDTIVKGDPNNICKEARLMVWANNQEEALRLAMVQWYTVYFMHIAAYKRQGEPLRERAIPTPVLTTEWGDMDRIKDGRGWGQTPKEAFQTLYAAKRLMGTGVHSAVRNASFYSLIKIHTDPLEYAVQSSLGSVISYMASCNITLDTTILDKTGVKYVPQQVEEAKNNIDTFVKDLR